MRFWEKMLTVHIYTIKRSDMRNFVKFGLLDFAVARVRTYIHTYKAVATGTAGTAMAVPLLRPLHLNDFVFNK